MSATTTTLILLVCIILTGFGFTVLRGSTFKGGKWSQETPTVPTDSIDYINGNPWTSISGEFITEVP